MKNWVIKISNSLITIGIIFVLMGFINIIGVPGLTKPRVVPIQDHETHEFKDSGIEFDLTITAYLKPEYNILYSYAETNVELKISLEEPNNCPKDIEEKGFSFWFFYEKINGSGSDGSIVSYDPVNFYDINIKPGESKTLHGWVKFTGEGEFRHVLWNASNNIRLEGTNKKFNVYPGYIYYQIESNKVVVSFSIITGGLSFIMVAFIFYQRYDKIEIEKRQYKNFKKLISLVKKINENLETKPKTKEEKNRKSLSKNKK